MSKRRIKIKIEKPTTSTSVDIGVGKELTKEATPPNIEEFTEPSLLWRDAQPKDMENELFKQCLKTPSKQKAKPKKTKKERTIIGHISDAHLGANINLKEVITNEFNWTIAARRLSIFAKQLADYKPHYRKDTKLHLVLNGDNICGVIHNQEWFADLLIEQYMGAIHTFSQMIGFLAQHFNDIEVTCTPGNHGRPMHKMGKDRGTTHKADSYENMVYDCLVFYFCELGFL